MTELVPRQPVGIQLLADLERAGAVTPTALVLPPDLPFDQYMALATMFGQLHRTSAWLIGDLLNYGERVYGETYAQAEAVTGLSRGTLMNYASVCSRIPRSRRRANLPFSTHAEVAYLEPGEQERWLEEAAQRGWTKSELREARTPKLTPAVEIECVCPTCGHPHSSNGQAVTRESSRVEAPDKGGQA